MFDVEDGMAQLIQIGLPPDHPYWRHYGLTIFEKDNFKGWVVQFRDFTSMKQDFEFGEDEEAARECYNKKVKQREDGIAICSHIDASMEEIEEYDNFWYEMDGRISETDCHLDRLTLAIRFFRR
jgi:hypothetical protein